MKIAICDDDSFFIDQLSKYLKKYGHDMQEALDIYAFKSGRKLLEYMRSAPDTDLIFLDILLDKFHKENGVAVAKEIRKFNSKVVIVFISSVDTYAIDGYDVNAAGYLLKPVEYTAFEIKMNRWIRAIKDRDNEFFYDVTDKGKILFEYQDIIYIETYERNTMLHTKSGDYISYRKMKIHEQILPEQYFSRCHASYIVNLSYIKGVKGLLIVLKDGMELPVSKMRKKEFLDHFFEYISLHFNK